MKLESVGQDDAIERLVALRLNHRMISRLDIDRCDVIREKEYLIGVKFTEILSRQRLPQESKLD